MKLLVSVVNVCSYKKWFYAKNGIDVMVMKFSTKEDYLFDGVNVVS